MASTINIKAFMKNLLDNDCKLFNKFDKTLTDKQKIGIFGTNNMEEIHSKYVSDMSTRAEIINDIDINLVCSSSEHDDRRFRDHNDFFKYLMLRYTEYDSKSYKYENKHPNWQMIWDIVSDTFVIKDTKFCLCNASKNYGSSDIYYSRFLNNIFILSSNLSQDDILKIYALMFISDNYIQGNTTVKEMFKDWVKSSTLRKKIDELGIIDVDSNVYQMLMKHKKLNK